MSNHEKSYLNEGIYSCFYTVARRLISRVEESNSLIVQCSREEIHLPVPLEPGQEVPNGIPQLSATAILHLEGGLPGSPQTEGLAVAESPENEVKAFLDAVINEVVKREQAKATTSETMSEMLGEVFKRPATPPIKKSLNEASKKGSKALIAVKRSHPPSRGKDMRKVLKLAKIRPSLFTPTTSSMVPRKRLGRRRGQHWGRLPDSNCQRNPSRRPDPPQEVSAPSTIGTRLSRNGRREWQEILPKTRTIISPPPLYSKPRGTSGKIRGDVH